MNIPGRSKNLQLNSAAFLRDIGCFPLPFCYTFAPFFDEFNELGYDGPPLPQSFICLEDVIAGREIFIELPVLHNVIGSGRSVRDGRRYAEEWRGRRRKHRRGHYNRWLGGRRGNDRGLQLPCLHGRVL
jgi:hypothetical protein